MDHLIDSFQSKTRITVKQVSSFDTYEKMEMGGADMVISHYKKDDGKCLLFPPALHYRTDDGGDVARIPLHLGVMYRCTVRCTVRCSTPH